MPRYVALLRAINVGGHVVKMDELRAHFEALRFARVESVIASGNILFDTSATADATLEARIEKRLFASLGYEVGTCVRSADEMARVAAHTPFRDDPVVEGDTLHVMFLKTALSADALPRVAALATSYDSFEVVGRELYWRTRGRSSDSKITPAAMNRALGGVSGTARNITTVRKLAARMTT